MLGTDGPHGAVSNACQIRGRDHKRGCIPRRQHRAALAIQTAWRGHTARTEFRRYRHGVVAAQGLWRSKLARRKLRALRAEAREAGKLMQDKRFLETKVAELTSTLELVQNQRNDLRQQFRVRAVMPNTAVIVEGLTVISFAPALETCCFNPQLWFVG